MNVKCNDLLFWEQEDGIGGRVAYRVHKVVCVLVHVK